MNLLRRHPKTAKPPVRPRETSRRFHFPLPRIFSRRGQYMLAAKVPDFGREYRRERIRQRRFGWIRNIAAKIPGLILGKARIAVLILVAIVVVLSAIEAVTYLNDRKVFIVSDIAVDGNKQIPTDSLMADLQGLIGKSMYSFSEADVENDLLQKHPYLKAADVRKQLPGKIVVSVEERYPTMVYVNLSRTYLVDQEKVIVNMFGQNDSSPLNPDELIVVQGYGDAYGQYVYEFYLSKIEDESEREDADWSQVSDDDKKVALQEYRNSLVIRVNSLLTANAAYIAGTEFTKLPVIMSYDASVFSVGERIPDFIYDISNIILSFLVKENMQPSRMLWQSNFTLEVDLSTGMELLFSTTRDIQDELTALKAVRQQGDLRGVTVIDLRSEIVAVK